MAANTSGVDTVSNLSTACTTNSARTTDDSKANRSIIRKIRKHDSSRLKNSSLLKAANRSIVCAKLQSTNRELANGYQSYKIRCDQLDRQVIELAEHCRMLTTENSQLADLVDILLTKRGIEIQKQRKALMQHATTFRRLVPQRATRVDKLLRARAVAKEVCSQPSSQQNSRVFCGYGSANSTTRGDVEPELELEAPNTNQTLNQTLNQSRLPFMYKPVGRAPPPLATDPTLSTIEASASEMTLSTDTGNMSSARTAAPGAATHLGALAQIVDCAEPAFGSPTSTAHNSASLSDSSREPENFTMQQPHAVSTRQRSVTQPPQQSCESPEIISRPSRNEPEDLAEAKYDKTKRTRRYSSLIGQAPVTTELEPERHTDPNITKSSIDEAVNAIGTAPHTNDDTVILSGFGLAGDKKYLGSASGSKTHESSHRYSKRSKGKSSATKRTHESAAAASTDHDGGAEQPAKTSEPKKHRQYETEIKVKRRSVITGLDHAIHRKRVTKQENKPSQDVSMTGKSGTDVYDDFAEATNQDDYVRSAIIARVNQSRLTQSGLNSRRTSVCESVSSNSTDDAKTDPKAPRTRSSGDAGKQSELTTESLIDAIMANMDRRRIQKGRRVRTVEPNTVQAPPAGAGESEKRTSSGNGLSELDANVNGGTKRLDSSMILGGTNTRRRSRLQQVETLDDPTSCGSSEPLTNATDILVNEVLNQAKSIAANEKSQSPSTNENCGLRRSKRSSVLNRSLADFDWQTYR